MIDLDMFVLSRNRHETIMLLRVISLLNCEYRQDKKKRTTFKTKEQNNDVHRLEKSN